MVSSYEITWRFAVGCHGPRLKAKRPRLKLKRGAVRTSVTLLGQDMGNTSAVIC